MSSYYITIFTIFPVLYGFLLEPSSSEVGGNKSSQGHTYLTVAEYLEAQKQQTGAFNNQQQTIEKTLDVLTSQLNNKFREFEKKLQETENRNESCQIDNSLHEKYTKLEKKYTELETKFEIQKNELNILRNETKDIDEKVYGIGQLKEIQSLQNIQTMEQRLHILDGNVSILTRNQYARNQDVIALFNEMVGLKTNATALENKQNTTLFDIQLLKSKLNQEVFITADGVTSQHGHSSGYIVKFPGVKSSAGISDLSKFKTSGKFTCEYSGLYLMIVTISSYKTIIQFNIYVNGKNVAYRYLDHNSQIVYQSATAFVIEHLNVQDTIYVQLGGATNVQGSISEILISKFN